MAEPKIPNFDGFVMSGVWQDAGTPAATMAHIREAVTSDGR